MTGATHKCAAIGCSAQVKGGMLMCFGHWRKVGKQRQARVWLWWGRMQGNPKQDHPDYGTWAKAYEAAVESAVERVAEQEGTRNAHQA